MLVFSNLNRKHQKTQIAYANAGLSMVLVDKF
jgi:hypothetical protein